MLDLQVNEQQIAKLKDKFQKYPPYAIGKAGDATAAYLNSTSVKQSIYPQSQSGQPFIWSSERQRRFVHANIKLPSTRTMNLANSGSFQVEKKYSSLYITYTNTASYAKWVIGNFTRIIGHITRGWKPVNTIIVDRERNKVLDIFRENVSSKTWNEL